MQKNKIKRTPQLKDHVHPGAVSEIQTTQIAVEDIVRSASLRVDRGRWFAVATIEAVALVFLMLAYIKQTVDAENNYDVAWVKMYKDGMWDIEFHDSEKSLEVLPAMIDAQLIQWVERRYSEVKETIHFDYGYVNAFMSNALSAEFVSAEGGNAGQVALDVLECLDCDPIKYKAYLVDHFDFSPSATGAIAGSIYRSNIYVRKTTGVFSGESQPGVGSGVTVDKRIIRIDWRLMSQQAIKNKARQAGGIDWLHENPIGLEIIAAVDLDDVSDAAAVSNTK